MTRLLPSTLAILLASSALASATPVYLALGDSITFGETDLNYVQSYGDRGYVSGVADRIAAQTGTRPLVLNLAIDGETAASFMSNSGRTPPVQGRGDAPLQLENLNYGNSTAVSQGTLLRQQAAAIAAAGNTINTVSITLGFNELAALAPPQNTPAAESAAIAAIPGTLAAYRTNYTAVLNEVRQLAPTATLYLLGYYNPFPADPGSPAAPIFNAGGTQLNAVIQSLATEFNAFYVDNAAPFTGHEAEYTYQAQLPAGSSVGGPYGGVLPIGNVHPNATGYAVIARDVAAATAVPEPGSLLLLAAGTAAAALGGRVARPRRRA